MVFIYFHAAVHTFKIKMTHNILSNRLIEKLETPGKLVNPLGGAPTEGYSLPCCGGQQSSVILVQGEVHCYQVAVKNLLHIPRREQKEGMESKITHLLRTK